MAMSLTKQLLCPVCGTILATAVRRRNGHSTLRTMPQLVRAMRTAAGECADLSG
jgi:hypothetical protein